jgi:DNA-binding Lrp family transcriptional regulator
MASPVSTQLEEIDRRLLNLLQMDFPLVARPFAALGEKLSLPEGEVLRRTRRLKAEGFVRQTSAIFDSQALGYRSALAAFQVEEGRLELVATAVNRHPGVSHNYARTHPYNLWFTLTVPARTDPQQEIERLAQENGVTRFLFLPTLRTFKVAVQFDMVRMEGQGLSQLTPLVPAGATSEKVNPDLVRALQGDLEIAPRPFLVMARTLGMSEEELLKEARRLQEEGVMRRFGAVLYHRRAGFSANAMAVWAVPTEKVEESGRRIASFPQVTHCYQRPTYPDWPYSIFSMVHAQTQEGCQRVVQEISRETGIREFTLLFSTKEYKKSRVRYFMD